jgi:hypothetical protein
MPQRHRPELSESVGADPIGSHRRTPRTFSAGRRCAQPGCTTLLSIYNGAINCAAHNPKQARGPRSRGPQPTAGETIAVVAGGEGAGTGSADPSPVRRLAHPVVEEVRRQAS